MLAPGTAYVIPARVGVWLPGGCFLGSDVRLGFVVLLSLALGVGDFRGMFPGRTRMCSPNRDLQNAQPRFHVSSLRTFSDLHNRPRVPNARVDMSQREGRADGDVPSRVVLKVFFEKVFLGVKLSGQWLGARRHSECRAILDARRKAEARAHRPRAAGPLQGSALRTRGQEPPHKPRGTI